MKNITKSIIAIFALLALSCTVEDVQDRPVIVGTDAPVLTAPSTGATYVLTFENASAQAERFTWKSANYAGDIQVTYTVEIDKKGNAFKTPQTLGSVVSQNQVSVTVEQMNNALKGLKATPLVSAPFEIRVKSAAGATAAMYSNVNTINITPYSTEIPKIAVPGNHQGWAPATAPQLAATKFGNTDFEGFVWLDGEYKFLSAKPDGTFDWGTTDWGDDGTFSGILKEKDEKNCTSPAGYYRVRADTKALTYTATRTVWGVIGDATPGGWDNSTAMTYNASTRRWTVTVNLTSGKEFKFRANNAWDINLGAFEASKPGVGSVMSYDGKNVAVTAAGSYLITLDLSNPRAYTYTAVRQ